MRRSCCLMVPRSISSFSGRVVWQLLGVRRLVEVQRPARHQMHEQVIAPLGGPNIGLRMWALSSNIAARKFAVGRAPAREREEEQSAFVDARSTASASSAVAAEPFTGVAADCALWRWNCALRNVAAGHRTHERRADHRAPAPLPSGLNLTVLVGAAARTTTAPQSVAVHCDAFLSDGTAWDSSRKRQAAALPRRHRQVIPASTSASSSCRWRARAADSAGELGVGRARLPRPRAAEHRRRLRARADRAGVTSDAYRS